MRLVLIPLIRVCLTLVTYTVQYAELTVSPLFSFRCQITPPTFLRTFDPLWSPPPPSRCHLDVFLPSRQNSRSTALFSFIENIKITGAPTVPPSNRAQMFTSADVISHHQGQCDPYPSPAPRHPTIPSFPFPVSSDWRSFFKWEPVSFVCWQPAAVYGISSSNPCFGNVQMDHPVVHPADPSLVVEMTAHCPPSMVIP